jgi:hypothetical protein
MEVFIMLYGIDIDLVPCPKDLGSFVFGLLGRTEHDIITD